MAMPEESGSKLICDTLLRLGVECVFGLPGTQNVALFEALRTSPLRTVIATHELSAAMMANGYHRASGRVAALITIPGPGFMWALAGVAEAALDSAALIHLVGLPASSPGQHYQLQAINQAAIAGSLVRAMHTIDRADDIVNVIEAAYADALTGEPGPVVVHVARSVLDEPAVRSDGRTVRNGPAGAVEDSRIDEAVRVMRAAGRCVIFAGQGTHHASVALTKLAEKLNAAVVTTTSGRGVIAEDHPLSLGFEFAGDASATLNELVAACDIVLAIGCKFSHNGSRGFRLRIPTEKLIHVDASDEVLGANYPARLAIRTDSAAFIEVLLERIGTLAERPRFAGDELNRFRERARAETLAGLVEPRIHGVASGKPADFFSMLRRLLPRDAVLLTDSGMHQSLARRHFPVWSPRGLITPTNLQSMGFGIGAATGACIAAPERTIVALIGDGGLAMSGLELLTAVRENLRLVVIVFVDGAYGLIRFQQLAATGRTFATEIAPPDVAALAESVGARYVRFEGDTENVLRGALEGSGVTLVEVAVGDTLPMHWMRAKAVARSVAGPRARTWLKRLLGRR